MDYIAWIKDELIPKLVNERKFSLPWSNIAAATIVDCQVNAMTTADAFMLTNCFKIKVTLSDESGEQKKDYGIVMKASPQWFPDDDHTFITLFQNEVYAYTELFEFLEWTEYLPKYYYSHIKGSKEAVIALSDFTLDGYKMYKEKGKLSLEHIYETVKLLGKFHGLSYALKHTNSIKFNEIKNLFKEGKYFEGRRYSEPWATIIGNGPKRIKATMEEYQTEHNVPIEFVDKLVDTIGYPLEYERIVYLDQSEPFATFSHGDFVRNNIAFKYSSYSDETPESLIMFDFQTIRYASPMIDLVNILAISTGVDIRSKHFDYIFTTYHNEMINSYSKKTNKNPDEMPDFLSYDSMLKEYGHVMPVGISIASFFLPLCLDKEGVDLEGATHLPLNDAVEKEFKRGGEYVNRELRALVCDYYRFYNKYNLKL